MEQEKDIAWKLRCLIDHTGDVDACMIMNDAANEIERLRAKLGPPCVYEARAYPSTGLLPEHLRQTRSWCMTHGWDCPNMGKERGTIYTVTKEYEYNHKLKEE